jgi:nucleoside phosphorylase
MPSELRPLRRPLGLHRSEPGGLWAGAAGETQVVAAVSGIGMRAGARAAERLLAAGGIDHLVVVGIAGGIGPSVAIGDVVVPERVVDLATGVELQPARLGARAPRGVLASSDALLGDPAEAARLATRGVIAVDMETAAAGAVCERRGCPWSVFRAISDRADDGSTDAAVAALAGPDGNPRFSAVARFVLAQPWRIPQLVRLGRGLSVSTRAAADAAVEALQRR